MGAMISAQETAAGVRAGTLRARDVAEARLADIAARSSTFNAFTDVTTARARAEADAVDAAVAVGRDPGPLAGVPVAVKNLFDLEGVTTLAGSAIERDTPPARRDAFLVRQMRAAGAVMCGALHMDEYAYGFTTENSHYGPARNPHDLTRSAGGSSGGSAAAVAAGLVPIALGSDTNGSIRVPASLCGIWGLKPTYGRLSRVGSFPFVHSFDHLGPFATSVADLALSYDVLQGEDAEDFAQQHRGVEPVAAVAEIGGLRIATLGGWFAEQVKPEGAEAVRAVARALGASREVVLPLAEQARAAAFLITMAEGGSLHLDNLRTRAMDFDPATRDRLLAGALLPAHWVHRAQRLRGLWRAQVLAAFADADILLAPATPCHAQPLGQAMMEIAGQEVPVRPSMGLLTQPISCIGLPVIAAPVLGFSLPIGVQLIAAPWREDVLFRAAALLEQLGVCGYVTPGGR
jgi:AtzE family amidohydrolase